MYNHYINHTMSLTSTQHYLLYYHRKITKNKRLIALYINFADIFKGMNIKMNKGMA